jgi:hypothetical protein
MVPEAGLEPARYFYRGILSPLCLPIPPLGQTLIYLLICIITLTKAFNAINTTFIYTLLEAEAGIEPA